MKTVDEVLQGVPHDTAPAQLVEVMWEVAPESWYTLPIDTETPPLERATIDTGIVVRVNLALSPLERLKARQPDMARRALEYRRQNGDPIENLVRLLTDLVDDPVLWKRVVDEPYG